MSFIPLSTSEQSHHLAHYDSFRSCTEKNARRALRLDTSVSSPLFNTPEPPSLSLSSCVERTRKISAVRRKRRDNTDEHKEGAHSRTKRQKGSSSTASTRRSSATASSSSTHPTSTSTSTPSSSSSRVVGPTLADFRGNPSALASLSKSNLGDRLLRGEGAAMAAFVSTGGRIPRRGEIGLTGDQIASFEAEGFVMSGSRHARMNAVRERKEAQVYSAAEGLLGQAERERQLAEAEQAKLASMKALVRRKAREAEERIAR
eukprot:CAMPEP_0170743986 /NCGR_PEP_ID=MMETSP0437-20130122/7549_1 /TAXON_ID=0 /ORGANISM="Sexangularia sp." /LENGTH=259 /DNA_ID=CAMNT_0011082669 /DNA_START=74 /DNA_END=850 /DNA_ORIENTATION=+